MPTIVNTYRYQGPSISDAFTKLGNSLFGPGRLQAELYRQKTQELGMHNEAQAGLANLAAKAAREGKYLDYNDPATRGYIYGLEAPNNAFIARRGIVANTAPDLASPVVTGAILGAGGAYSSTPQGFNAGEATKVKTQEIAANKAAATQQAIADNTPVLVLDPTNPNGMKTVSRAEAIAKGLTMVPDASHAEGAGKLRVLQNGPGGMTPEQLHAAGAQPTNEKVQNYLGPDGKIYQTADGGRTDVRTGQPLPPGGGLAALQATPDQAGLSKTTQTQLQGQNIAMERMRYGIKRARELITPENVGAPGLIKGGVQDIVQMAGGLSSALGLTSADDVLADIKKRATSSGGDPDKIASLFAYDPKLPQLSTAYYALTMAAADAIAGGLNKASDKDVKRVIDMLGSPESLFTSAQTLQAKLDEVERTINNYQSINSRALGGQTFSNILPKDSTPAPTQAAPAQPTLHIDINGNPIQ